eukprot:TRINITY_DN17389_c0_g1_i1.p2 TRINITY_DN17389_c0_g1~~TRINITY_DN17389_c0_g1_i1.p2  ORF type:complete len:124 (-),score=4.56 TRINITY_DN17389_c0_g1_i1:167-538(-)
MHAYGGVQYMQGMVPTNRTKNDLIDAYDNHTKNCKYCMGALANFQKLQIGAWVACAICVICTICYMILSPMVPINVPFYSVVKLPTLRVLVFALSSLIFGILGLYANSVIPKFYKTEFCHADN